MMPTHPVNVNYQAMPRQSDEKKQGIQKTLISYFLKAREQMTGLREIKSRSSTEGVWAGLGRI